MKEKVTIYTAPNCKFCNDVKILLKSYGVQYEELDVREQENLERLYNFDERIKTVPQVFIGEEYVGGYEKTREWFLKKLENKEL